MQKVINQKDIVTLSQVREFYQDFKDEDIKDKYKTLVECLKRNKGVEEFKIEDINKILDSFEKDEEEI